MNEDFIDKVLKNPEWEVIRKELCGPALPYNADEVMGIDLGGGSRVWLGEFQQTKKEAANLRLHSQLCWYINNGPGYCEDAPEEVKVYLRRVGIF